MRISSNTIFDSNVAAMTQQQARLLQTQQQITSGRRILTAADDPVAAARALDISQSDAMNTQYASNRQSAKHTLSVIEANLQSVTTLLQDAKTAAVTAGNGSYTDSDRKSIANDLRGRLEELAGYANSTDGVGNYLFAGYQTRTQPFVDTPAGMGYFGDDGERLAQVSASRQMSASNSGAEVFMRIKNGNGTFLTAAAATNTGTGIVSQGAVTKPSLLTGHNYTIAFAAPAAADAGNAGNGTISTPTGTPLTSDDFSIVFTSPTTYDVTRTTTAVPPVGPTPVSAGNPYVSGQAISVDGLSFIIQDGTVPFAAGDTFTVASSPGYTVTDTTTATQELPPAPPGRVPYVSGQAISFDGLQFDIQGAPTTGDTFTVTPSANESMFTTISDLIDLLSVTPVGASLTNGLNRSLNHLDNALNNVLTVRASLGVRLNEVDALQAEGDNLALQFRQSLSLLQDVDYNKAISDLTMQKTALQAAQQTFAQVAGLSLFNYI